MTDLIFDVLPWDTLFEIVFGLFVTVLIFLLDNRSKARQEETLKHQMRILKLQDDALDIILDQVSKVNAFQTKSLSIAIETISQDLETLNNRINYLDKSIMASRGLLDNGTQREMILSPSKTPTSEEQSLQPPTTIKSMLGSTFSKIISKQIDTMIDNVKNSLSDINESDPKDEYRKKKELSFDLKNLLRIKGEELKAKKARIRDNERIKDSNGVVPAIEDKISLTKLQEEETKQFLDDVFDEKPDLPTSEILELEDKLDSLSSITEITSFAESILTNLGLSKSTQKIAGEKAKKFKERYKRLKESDEDKREKID